MLWSMWARMPASSISPSRVKAGWIAVIGPLRERRTQSRSIAGAFAPPGPAAAAISRCPRAPRFTGTRTLPPACDRRIASVIATVRRAVSPVEDVGSPVSSARSSSRIADAIPS